MQHPWATKCPHNPRSCHTTDNGSCACVTVTCQPLRHVSKSSPSSWHQAQHTLCNTKRLLDTVGNHNRATIMQLPGFMLHYTEQKHGSCSPARAHSRDQSVGKTLERVQGIRWTIKHEYIITTSCTLYQRGQRPVFGRFAIFKTLIVIIRQWAWFFWSCFIIQGSCCEGKSS
jgi:hypothetical protein